jgi:hypothetical protein
MTVSIQTQEEGNMIDQAPMITLTIWNNGSQEMSSGQPIVDEVMTLEPLVVTLASVLTALKRLSPWLQSKGVKRSLLQGSVSFYFSEDLPKGRAVCLVLFNGKLQVYLNSEDEEHLDELLISVTQSMQGICRKTWFALPIAKLVQWYHARTR